MSNKFTLSYSCPAFIFLTGGSQNDDQTYRTGNLPLRQMCKRLLCFAGVFHHPLRSHSGNSGLLLLLLHPARIRLSDSPPRQAASGQILTKERNQMLLIRQLYYPQRLKSEYVICPACKHGRLCDKPQGEKIAVLSLSGNTEAPGSFHGLILKCPRCAQRFIISIEN